MSDEVGFDPSIAYCVEGCGQLAVAENLNGMTEDGDEVVDLVCYDHKERV